MFRSYRSFALVILIVMQSYAVDTNIKQADTYIAHLRRGISCYWHRKPCSAEDQKAVNQTIIGTLTLVAAISIPSTFYYLDSKAHRITQNIVKAVNSLDVNQVKQSIKTYEKYFNEKPSIEPLIWHICNKMAPWVQEFKHIGAQLTPEQRAIKDPLHSDANIRAFVRLGNKVQNAVNVAKELISYGYNPDEEIDYMGNKFTLRSKLPTLNLPQPILKDIGLAL